MPKFYSVRRAGLEVGDGMYSGSGGLFACSTYEGNWERHPAPEDDSALEWDSTERTLGVRSEYCFFGFASPDQLRAWLYNSEWREHLHRKGYVIKMWELADTEMHAGNAQAIAVREALRNTPFEVIGLLSI